MHPRAQGVDELMTLKSFGHPKESLRQAQAITAPQRQCKRRLFQRRKGLLLSVFFLREQGDLLAGSSPRPWEG